MPYGASQSQGSRSTRARSFRFGVGVLSSVVALGGLADSQGSNDNPGAPLLVVRHEGTNEVLGAALAAAGDLDGDGWGDILAGAPAGIPSRAYVLSGKDGSLLREFEVHAGPTGLFGGMALCSVGDLDGRGQPDFLVGSQWIAQARVFAGEDGEVLFDSGSMEENSEYGLSVAGLGDLDGDGTPDFAVGFRSGFGVPGIQGGVIVHSGRDGAVLATVPGPGDGTDPWAPLPVVPLPDLDGDGVPELALASADYRDGEKGFVGKVAVHSGKDFREVRSVIGQSPYETLGWALATLGSPGQPTRWLAAGAPAADGYRGRLVLIDAATGERVRDWRGRKENADFGGVAFGMGDVDGDGFPDLGAISGTFFADGKADYGNLVEVFSGETGRLLFSRRGWPDDGVITAASAGDVDGDGREDLVVGALSAYEGQDGEVRVFQVEPDPDPPVVRVALQRRPEVPGAKGVGFLDVFGARASSQPFVAKARQVDSGPGVFVEDAPGAGTFTKVGELRFTGNRSANWTLDMKNASSSAPLDLRVATPASLAGRRVQAGDLQAVIPASGQLGAARKAALSSPEPAPVGGASGVVRSSSSEKRGTAKVSVRSRRLPRTATYAVWIEEGPESGTFAQVGDLRRGRLVLNTARGDPLPGGVAGGTALSGRAIEVRDGETVVLRGTLP